MTTTTTMTTHDGLTLRARADDPPDTPCARVVLVHGIGDQVDGVPYVTAAAALCARGFAVRRLELRGHGRSEGRRAYVAAWSDFRDDVGRFVDRVASEHPARPLFLAGISMGGLIVTNYAAHRPEGLRGVIALAPALGDTGGSRVLLALLPVLSTVVPALAIDPKLDLQRLTRDRDLQRAYLADPLYQTRVTPRLAAELQKAVIDTRARASAFGVPLLVMHGTADTLTSPAASAEFVQRAGVGDKRYRQYEGAYHNLFVETNREEVYDEMAAWMNARVPDAK
jgi:alpha-beta hydrolase superfamily lysophospholipase